jgi:hypothetical protein
VDNCKEAERRDWIHLATSNSNSNSSSSSSSNSNSSSNDISAILICGSEKGLESNSSAVVDRTLLYVQALRWGKRKRWYGWRESGVRGEKAEWEKRLN